MAKICPWVEVNVFTNKILTSIFRPTCPDFAKPSFKTWTYNGKSFGSTSTTLISPHRKVLAVMYIILFIMVLYGLYLLYTIYCQHKPSKVRAKSLFDIHLPPMERPWEDYNKALKKNYKETFGRLVYWHLSERGLYDELIDIIVEYAVPQYVLKPVYEPIEYRQTWLVQENAIVLQTDEEEDNSDLEYTYFPMTSLFQSKEGGIPYLHSYNCSYDEKDSRVPVCSCKWPFTCIFQLNLSETPADFRQDILKHNRKPLKFDKYQPLIQLFTCLSCYNRKQRVISAFTRLLKAPKIFKKNINHKILIKYMHFHAQIEDNEFTETILAPFMSTDKVDCSFHSSFPDQKMKCCQDFDHLLEQIPLPYAWAGAMLEDSYPPSIPCEPRLGGFACNVLSPKTKWVRCRKCKHPINQLIFQGPSGPFDWMYILACPYHIDQLDTIFSEDDPID